MSQTGRRDSEKGGSPGPVDGHHGHHHRHRHRSLQGESNYGDSSMPLYFRYSKIAEEEDNKIVEYCHKDTDGTLILSGLFAATVGALLTVSIPDLKPNPQDTSAFYLKNMYLSSIPNVSNSSNPSALAKPPAFSPPSYAIWVNSLWFLSLAVSLSGATVATLYRNWVVQYIAVTQQPGYTLEKRARIRAIFAQGNPGLSVIWGTGGGPIFLHLSLLLFVIGAVIYLFNINYLVFYAVVWWVMGATILYTLRTVAGFFKPHDLLHTPLSPLALHIYLGISYVVARICSYIPPLYGLGDNTMRRYHDLSNCYRNGFLIGKQRAAWETASKPSSEIDALILEQILLTLNEDNVLEAFFDTIPGFCNSKLSVLPLSIPVQRMLRQALGGFLDRTFSSNPVSESVRASRLITCLNAAHAALGPNAVSGILGNIFNGHWDEALQSVEIGHALRLWVHSRDHDLNVRRIVACIIARVRRRDDRWTMLVKETFGVLDRVPQDYLAHGDSVLLFILLHISRQSSQAGSWSSGVLSSLSNFDIRNTLPELQHDFCSLWNEIVQKARNQGVFGPPVQILRDIRHLYITLHQGTDAAPTAFTASTPIFDFILFAPSSYPLCDIDSHHPSSTVQVPVPLSIHSSGSPTASPATPSHSGSAVSQQAEQADIIVEPPSPSTSSTTNEIGGTSHAPIATLRTNAVYSNPRPTDTSSTGDVAAVLQGITRATTLSHSMESVIQQDMSMPCAAPAVGQTSSTVRQTVPAPASSLAPAPESDTDILNKSIASCDSRAASTPEPLLPASSVASFSIHATHPPSPVPPRPNVKFLSPSSSHPTGNVTLPRLRARGLVNTGSMCFANAVLQLLVHSPPFWNLFKQLGNLKGYRGAEGSNIGGGATPLVDAMVRFLEEFMFKEKEPPPTQITQQLLQHATRRKTREDEEEKNENIVVGPFEPTYMYDAMNVKRQLKGLLDGQQQDAEELLGLYLDALDEELVEHHNFTSRHTPASTPSVGELKEEAQPAEGQTELGKRDYTASSAESPISRIFSGRSRSTIRAPRRPDTVTIEAWQSLQLDIQSDLVHTIQDALAHFSQPQPVQVDQSSSIEASQQVLLEALPSVLVLHLKRLLYDAAADDINKIRKPIHLVPELEIPQDLMVPDAGRSADPVYYKLHGVLYHHGGSADSGHYTVDVLHPNGDSGTGEAWLHIDDEAVSAVRQEDVFEDHNIERVDDRCAYMLFYCRTAPTQAQ